MKVALVLLLLFFNQADIRADMESDKAAAAKALSESNFEEAATIYEAVLKAHPEDGEAHYRLGMALMELNRLEESEQQFRLAGEDGFQPLSVSYRLARVQARKGDIEAALVSLEEMASGGFPNTQIIENEPDFDSLRNEPRYASAMETIAQSRYPCKTNDKNRQFDFWVSQWDVDYLGQPAGTNDVRLILGDCVIFENWESVTGNLGKSFNYYDAGEDHWRQIWVDDTGGVIEFTGEVRDGNMYYTATTHDPETKAPTLHKMTFTPNNDGSVNQLWEQSSDNGETWNSFDGHYVKKSADSENSD